jgi:polyprenyldihydroxybenzoate methyltransferase/3-demethylubiquinol 3-O-methyltransferase
LLLSLDRTLVVNLTSIHDGPSSRSLIPSFESRPLRMSRTPRTHLPRYLRSFHSSQISPLPKRSPLSSDQASSASSSSSSAPPPKFTTINPSEISHFSSLSQHWWDPHGEFGLLHKMNPPRVEYIRQKVALDTRDEEPWTFERRFELEKKGKGEGNWLKGKRCLDVGCGGGLLSEVREVLEG